MTFIPADTLGFMEAPEEVLTTLIRDGKREWMYATVSAGCFYKWRRAAARADAPASPTYGRATPAIRMLLDD